MALAEAQQKGSRLLLLQERSLRLLTDEPHDVPAEPSTHLSYTMPPPATPRSFSTGLSVKGWIQPGEISKITSTFFHTVHIFLCEIQQIMFYDFADKWQA